MKCVVLGLAAAALMLAIATDMHATTVALVFVRMLQQQEPAASTTSSANDLLIEVC
jgi:hypothetical protein